jgi:hypothetical protein
VEDWLEAPLTLNIRIGQNPQSVINVYVPGLPDAAAMALFSLPAVLDLTTWPTRIPTTDAEYLVWDDESRSWRYGHEKYNGIVGGYVTVDSVGQIWVGMAALWFLGKLADAYVARLADWMAETTVATLRRVRATKSDNGQFLVIKVPEHVTMMILPEAGLTDEAKEAFIDLDPNADGIRGKLLSWSPEAGRWLPQNDAIPPPDA